MTIFIVNGEERELRYDVGGIDISRDFIGNTYHGMDMDEDGRYLATPEDYKWWQDCIDSFQKMDTKISAYKEQFDADEVDQVVSDWSGGDYETDPAQVIMGLEKNFGEL